MAQRFVTRTRSASEGALQVEGAREFRRDLKAIDAALPRVMRIANLAAAELVAVEARRRATVSQPDVGKPGHIQSTIRAQATTRSAILAYGSAAFPYPFPLEFGWPSRGIEARPAIYSSIAAKSEAVMEQYGQFIDDAYRFAFPISRGL